MFHARTKGADFYGNNSTILIDDFFFERCIRKSMRIGLNFDTYNNFWAFLYHRILSHGHSYLNTRERYFRGLAKEWMNAR